MDTYGSFGSYGKGGGMKGKGSYGVKGSEWGHSPYGKAGFGKGGYGKGGYGSAENDSEYFAPGSKAKGRGKQLNTGSRDQPEKIFVGNLPKTITADDLEAHFSTFGEVRSVDLKLDYSGVPRGFAFIVFDNAESAQQVLDNSEDMTFDGERIDCKPAMEDKGKGKGKGSQDGNFRGDASTPVTEKLFVNNLPPGTTEESLNCHFSQYAEVKMVALKNDPASGAFRGFGFVTLDSKESAELILDTPDAFDFEGKALDIKPAAESSYKGGSKDKDKGKGKGKGRESTIWVGCIPLKSSKAEVWKYFEYFGVVIEVNLEYDDMQLPNGCGHVTFASADSARAVLGYYSEDSYDPLEFEPGILLDVKPAAPEFVPFSERTDAPVTEKIFVGGLPRHSRQEDVQAHYSQFGALKEVHLKCGADGSPKGHAFVTYRDVDSAKKALEGATLGTCRPYAKFETAKEAFAEPTTNVLKLSGLPKDPRSRDVFRYFSKYSVTRIRDTGEDILIEFTTEAECKKAFKDKFGGKIGNHFAELSGGTREEMVKAGEMLKPGGGGGGNSGLAFADDGSGWGPAAQQVYGNHYGAPY